MSRPVCYLFLSNDNTCMQFFIQCQDDPQICFLKECKDLCVICLFTMLRPVCYLFVYNVKTCLLSIFEEMSRPVCYLFLDTMLRPVLLFVLVISRPLMNISLDIALRLLSETHQISKS